MASCIVMFSAPPAAAAAQDAVTWLGFALSCSACSVPTSGGGYRGVWAFASPPEIYLVDPGGPAYHAGLRSGDVLTHVDGLLLTAPDGQDRFGNAAPGDTLLVRYEREGVSRTATLVVGVVRGRAALRFKSLSRSPSALRYSGILGPVDVRVDGSEAVHVSERPGEIVIEVAGSRILLRLRESRGDDGP